MFDATCICISIYVDTCKPQNSCDMDIIDIPIGSKVNSPLPSETGHDTMYIPLLGCYMMQIWLEVDFLYKETLGRLLQQR